MNKKYDIFIPKEKKEMDAFLFILSYYYSRDYSLVFSPKIPILVSS